MMPRKKNKAVPVSNAPVPQNISGLLGGITMGELRRIMSEGLDKALDKSFDELKKNLDIMSETTEKMLRATEKRLAVLEHDARRPRLTTETDVPTVKKTRKHAQDAAADQAKHGDRCSAKRLDTGPTCSTSFGMTADPPALSRRNDVVFDKGAEAPKSHFPSVEVRMLLSATGDQIPAGTASTAIRTIFPQPLFSWSLGEVTKKSNSRTNNQLAPFCWRIIIHAKSRQKVWCSIPAVLQVVYAPARFWEGGARCFVGRFSFGRQMVLEDGAFF